MTDNATPGGGSIRTRRLAAGMTQERLAREADCSTPDVRVVERGYVPAKPERSAALGRMYAVLGLSLDGEREGGG